MSMSSPGGDDILWPTSSSSSVLASQKQLLTVDGPSSSRPRQAPAFHLPTRMNRYPSELSERPSVYSQPSYQANTFAAGRRSTGPGLSDVLESPAASVHGFRRSYSEEGYQPRRLPDSVAAQPPSAARMRQSRTLDAIPEKSGRTVVVEDLFGRGLESNRQSEELQRTAPQRTSLLHRIKARLQPKAQKQQEPLSAAREYQQSIVRSYGTSSRPRLAVARQPSRRPVRNSRGHHPVSSARRPTSIAGSLRSESGRPSLQQRPISPVAWRQLEASKRVSRLYVVNGDPTGTADQQAIVGEAWEDVTEPSPASRSTHFHQTSLTTSPELSLRASRFLQSDTVDNTPAALADAELRRLLRSVSSQSFSSLAKPAVPSLLPPPRPPRASRRLQGQHIPPSPALADTINAEGSQPRVDLAQAIQEQAVLEPAKTVTQPERFRRSIDTFGPDRGGSGIEIGQEPPIVASSSRAAQTDDASSPSSQPAVIAPLFASSEEPKKSRSNRTRSSWQSADGPWQATVVQGVPTAPVRGLATPVLEQEIDAIDRPKRESVKKSRLASEPLARTEPSRWGGVQASLAVLAARDEEQESVPRDSTSAALASDPVKDKAKPSSTVSRSKAVRRQPSTIFEDASAGNTSTTLARQERRRRSAPIERQAPLRQRRHLSEQLRPTSAAPSKALVESLPINNASAQVVRGDSPNSEDAFIVARQRIDLERAIELEVLQRLEQLIVAAQEAVKSKGVDGLSSLSKNDKWDRMVQSRRQSRVSKARKVVQEVPRSDQRKSYLPPEEAEEAVPDENVVRRSRRSGPLDRWSQATEKSSRARPTKQGYATGDILAWQRSASQIGGPGEVW